jgi:lysophospholipase L1-like esterase
VLETQQKMKTACFAALAAISTACALAQAPTSTGTTQPANPRPPWELEWAYLSRYRDADAKLGPPGVAEKRIVFLGDSITEGWGKIDGKFFAGRPYVNRGIGGQTTSQMLVRFRQDVISLKPAAVVILGGTNDIAQNGGLTTVEAVEDNLQSMVELAQLHGIRVILASVLPAIDYPWRPGLQPRDKISALNRWMSEFCGRNKAIYLDYYSVMADANLAMKPGFSKDGVHPNEAGYLAMEPLAEEAIGKALR